MYYYINTNIRPVPFPLEGDELKWYMPASNQLIGIYIGSSLNITSGNTTTEDGNGSVKRWYNGLNSYYKTDGGSRCVRDIGIKQMQF